jgi:hypothetical protein
MCCVHNPHRPRPIAPLPPRRVRGAAYNRAAADVVSGRSVDPYDTRGALHRWLAAHRLPGDYLTAPAGAYPTDTRWWADEQARHVYVGEGTPLPLRGGERELALLSTLHMDARPPPATQALLKRLQQPWAAVPPGVGGVGAPHPAVGATAVGAAAGRSVDAPAAVAAGWQHAGWSPLASSLAGVEAQFDALRRQHQARLQQAADMAAARQPLPSAWLGGPSMQATDAAGRRSAIAAAAAGMAWQQQQQQQLLLQHGGAHGGPWLTGWQWPAPPDAAASAAGAAAALHAAWSAPGGGGGGGGGGMGGGPPPVRGAGSGGAYGSKRPVSG